MVVIQRDRIVFNLRWSLIYTTLFIKLVLASLKNGSLSILPGDVKKVRLMKYDIIPHFIPHGIKFLLQVNFSDAEVEFGNLLRPDQVYETPKHFEGRADHDEYYTLVMTDLDYPSPENPEDREYLHWMVSNINHLCVEEGHLISEYVAPNMTNPQGGIHRYLFSLYYQRQGPMLFADDYHLKSEFPDHSGRLGFSTKGFGNKHDLGSPVAANFFRIDWSQDYRKN